MINIDIFAIPGQSLGSWSFAFGCPASPSDPGVCCCSRRLLAGTVLATNRAISEPDPDGHLSGKLMSLSGSRPLMYSLYDCE